MDRKVSPIINSYEVNKLLPAAGVSIDVLMYRLFEKLELK